MGVHVVGPDRDRPVIGRQRFAVAAKLSERDCASAEDLDHVRIQNQNSLEAGEGLVGPASAEERKTAIEQSFGRFGHQCPGGGLCSKATRMCSARNEARVSGGSSMFARRVMVNWVLLSPSSRQSSV